MLGKLHCKGFEAVVLSHCETYDGVLYLRLLAPPTAEKAIWAALNSSAARRGGAIDEITLELPGSEHTRSVSLVRGIKYLAPRVTLDCGYTDLAFLHPDATVSAGRDTFYLICEDGSPEPPPAFFPMLNARLSLPLLPAWAPWLWREALEGYVPPDYAYKWRIPKPVEEVGARGAPVYKVRADDEAAAVWLAVIRRGLGFDLARWEEAA
jgi:hypothetical protein